MPLVVLVPLGSAALLFLLFPATLLLVLAFTMGLGLPLVVVPTAAVYMAAALLPAALLRFCKLPQPLAFGAAALGAFAVGFGIPWYAESSAERAAARLPGESRVEVG